MKTKHERGKKKRGCQITQRVEVTSKVLTTQATQTRTDLLLLPLQGHGSWLPGCSSVAAGETGGGGRQGGGLPVKAWGRSTRSEKWATPTRRPDKVAEWRARTPTAQRSARLRPITADKRRFVSKVSVPLLAHLLGWVIHESTLSV